MGGLRFEFTGLRSDADELRDDLDVLYHLGADWFGVCNDLDEIFSESDFAVVEFAQAVNSWLSRGFELAEDLVFAPSGYEGRAVLFRHRSDDWCVDSDFRSPKVPSALVDERELRASLLDFRERLAYEAQTCGIDVDAVLDRLANYAL